MVVLLVLVLVINGCCCCSGNMVNPRITRLSLKADFCHKVRSTSRNSRSVDDNGTIYSIYSLHIAVDVFVARAAEATFTPLH